MRKEDKFELVQDLTKKFKENNIFYLLDASGLSVDQVNSFRESCFKRDVEYKVVKNTFIKKALENQEEDYSEIINGDALKGFSGLLFANQSPSGPAKVLKEFRKSLDSDHPSLKVASIESDIFVGDNHLDSLSKLKGKEEIIGDIVLLLQSPAKNIISLLKSSENKISGVVKIINYSVVDDFGKVINPLLLEGQVHGGIAQGIGQALLEETIYDEETGQLLSGSFIDYAIPRASDMPFIKFSYNEILCTTNPLGVKGAGEAGAIGAPPAVINAICNALDIDHIDMPAKPEKIWKILSSKKFGI